MGISLDHDLLNLILLDGLVDSVLLAGGKSGELVETIGTGGQIVTVKRDSEGLTDSGIVDIHDTSGLLLLEFLLCGLNLTSENHQAPKISRYIISTIQIRDEKCGLTSSRARTSW